MYLSFDTETTGLPRNWKAPLTDLDNWPRLVEIAWVLFDESGRELEAEAHLIKPNGFSIPGEATEIHGISHDEAMSSGSDLQTVLSAFTGAVQNSAAVISHNVSFDEKIVGAEMLRNKMSNVLGSATKVCTKEISTDYCRLPGKYGYKWPTLQELHQVLFSVGFSETHRAADDARVCAKCFFELKRLGVSPA